MDEWGEWYPLPGHENKPGPWANRGKKDFDPEPTTKTKPVVVAGKGAHEPSIGEMQAAIEKAKIKEEYWKLVESGVIAPPAGYKVLQVPAFDKPKKGKDDFGFGDDDWGIGGRKPIKPNILYNVDKYDDAKTHIYDGDFDGNTADRGNMIRQNIMADSNRKVNSGLRDRLSNVNVDNVAKSGQTLNDNFKDAINQVTDQFKD